MVSRVGSYYGTPFKVHCGVTQGIPLSTTIFNMVVDVVIFHWVILVAREEAGPDGFVQEVQCLVAFLYTNDGLIASPSPNRLQAVLDVLTGLSVRVGLQTNVDKTVGMVYQPCYIIGGHSEAEYTG